MTNFMIHKINVDLKKMKKDKGRGWWGWFSVPIIKQKQKKKIAVEVWEKGKLRRVLNGHKMGHLGLNVIL